MAPSTFEAVTKVAIEEMILAHAKESKFGYVMTKAACQALVGEFYTLLVTSRNLKAKGDRMLEHSQKLNSPSADIR